jgi:hypothetical protein
MRRLGTWALALFAAFYLCTQPAGAAGVVRHAFNGVHQAATSLADFVNHLQ